MELHKGRPESCEGRLPREIRVYDFLDKLGLEYDRTDHDHADHMSDCYEIDAILNATICKNLFLCNRQKTQFYLLMMPGDKPFKTKELSSQINSARLSFASPEDMEKYIQLNALQNLNQLTDSTSPPAHENTSAYALSVPSSQGVLLIGISARSKYPKLSFELLSKFCQP